MISLGRSASNAYTEPAAATAVVELVETTFAVYPIRVWCIEMTDFL